jgi:UDP-3-O-[3-hydroxymyristoyl] glucosamine N-acyltransferase
MPKTLAELAQHTGARVVGEDKVRIAGVASVDSARDSDLVFVEDESLLPGALASRAAAVIAGEFAQNGHAGKKPLLIHRQPRLAFTRAARLLMPREGGGGVYPTAVVHHSAKLGKDVVIDAGAVIEPKAEIGDRSYIGAYAVVGRGVKVGCDCRIGPHVTLYPQTTLGDRVVVQAGSVLGSAGFGYVRDAESGRYEQFPQVGRLEIADDVEIGANCTIDRGALDATVLARGVKLDNLVHIGHNVQVGENVVIAAQTGISGSSVIEKNAIVGGQVGIGDHAVVGEGAILGSGSGVLSKKIVRGKGIIFWGRPARPLAQYLRELAVLARLAKKDKKTE